MVDIYAPDMKPKWVKRQNVGFKNPTYGDTEHIRFVIKLNRLFQNSKL